MSLEFWLAGVATELPFSEPVATLASHRCCVVGSGPGVLRYAHAASHTATVGGRRSSS